MLNAPGMADGSGVGKGRELPTGPTVVSRTYTAQRPHARPGASLCPLCDGEGVVYHYGFRCDGGIRKG